MDSTSVLGHYRGGLRGSTRELSDTDRSIHFHASAGRHYALQGNLRHCRHCPVGRVGLIRMRLLSGAAMSTTRIAYL